MGESMFLLGIGKRKHVASMIGDDGKAVFKALSFENTGEGIESLFAKIREHGGTLTNRPVLRP